MSSLRLIPLQRDGVYFCVEIGDIAGLDRDAATGKPLAGFPGGGTAQVDRVAPLIEVESDRVLPFPPWVREGLPALLAAVIWEHRMPLLVSHAWFTGGNAAAPPSILPLLDRRFGAAGLATPPAGGRPLTFELSCRAPEGVRCAISLMQVYELVDTLSLRQIPGAPPWLAGAIPWRGQAVPAVDLGLLLGLGPSGPCTKAIVARGLRNPQPVAIPVLSAAQGAPPCHAAEPPPPVDPAAVLAAFRTASGWIVVPDLDRLTSA